MFTTELCRRGVSINPSFHPASINRYVRNGYAGNRYAGRLIAMASLHGKERILARPLKSGLGLTLRHASSVDTDRFGSFDGERPRQDDAPTTCQRKAVAALETLDLDLGIASEGSFGPHPAVPMLPVGQECMTFVDRRDGLVIHEQLVSHRTNYGSCSGSEPEAIAGWLHRIGFPRHGLMIRPLEPEPAGESDWLAKGVHDPRQLATLIAEAVRRSPLGLARLETDMRAHCNPTRRIAIRQLAFRLVRRLASTCPSCGAPGWGVVATIAGLPCSACGLATALVKLEVMGCSVCTHRTEHPRRDRRSAADPMHCPYCNP